ncbi:MAG: hypothetical protein AB7T63_17975 [Planctomycetota bacterium]
MTISHAVRRHYAERIFAVGGRGEVPEAFRPLAGEPTGRSTVEGCRGGGKNVLEVRLRVADGRVEGISMGCNLCNPAMYVAADILGRWARGRSADAILALDPFAEAALDPWFEALGAPDRPADAAEKFRYTLWAVQNALRDDRGEAPRPTPDFEPDASDPPTR